jgi:hypothetical protein
LGGRYHNLLIARIGKRWSFFLCSTICGPIIDKANAMLARLPKGHLAQDELRNLINEAKEADTWVNEVWHVVEEGQEFNTAQREFKRLEDMLKDIETRHPDAIVPDIVPEAGIAPPEQIVPEGEPIPIAPEAPAPAVPQVLPPPGEAADFLHVGRDNLSLRGLDAELPLGQQLAEGEMSALKRSPNLQGVGAEDLPFLSPRDLATMVAENQITKKVFDGIMKAAEERIAARGGG